MNSSRWPFAMAIALAGAACAQPALAQESSITVKVMDKRKAPVVGTILLNPGKLRIGKTKNDGAYTFRHACQVGQTFKAEPEDAAQYYDSDEQVCGKVVVLEVFPRPQTASIGKSDAYVITELAPTPNSTASKFYAGVFGVVRDKSEAVVVDGRGKCKVTIDKKFEVAYYNASMAGWKHVPDSLIKGTPTSDGSIYYFPTSCEASWQEIGNLKRQASNEVRTDVLKFYKTNSLSIDTAIDQAAQQRK
jgi:hypothetical protein